MSDVMYVLGVTILVMGSAVLGAAIVVAFISWATKKAVGRGLKL